MLTDEQTIPLAEIPLAGYAGVTWNRLHDEREEICDALRKEPGEISNGRRELLQDCLRKVDDELDRIMSVYEEGTEVTETTGGLKLDSLKPFDIIKLRTRNSDYRILLLDPLTGRVLVEGGNHLPEPSEALVRGSAICGLPFKEGSLDIGSRLEMWVDEKVFITSPIESLEVQRQ